MGTLQVGGTTLGVKNTSTNKIDLSNVGDNSVIPASVGASLQLIQTNTFSLVSESGFQDVFSSDFRNYKIIGAIDGLSGSLRFQFYTTGTTVFDSSVYSNAGIGRDDSGTTRNQEHSDIAYWELDHDTANQSCFEYIIYQPFLTTDSFFVGTSLTERTSGTLYITMAQGGSVDSATSFSGGKCYTSAGTVSGTLSIYGIKE